MVDMYLVEPTVLRSTYVLAGSHPFVQLHSPVKVKAQPNRQYSDGQRVE